MHLLLLHYVSRGAVGSWFFPGLPGLFFPAPEPSLWRWTWDNFSRQTAALGCSTRGVATHLPNQTAKEKGTYAQKKQVHACVRACKRKVSPVVESAGRVSRARGKDTPPERRFLLGIDGVMVVSFINSRCVRVHTSYEVALRPGAREPSRTWSRA